MANGGGDRGGFLGKLEEDNRAMAGHQQWGGSGKGPSMASGGGDRTGFLGKLEEDNRSMAGHQQWGRGGKG
eukprot:348889-Amorphochlora_amoeboformis.AAC.1